MRRLGILTLVVACSPPTTIQDQLLADRDHHDTLAMRHHGWELWARLSAGEWDHWTPTETLFQNETRAKPKLRTPRPFRNGGEISYERLPVMFDVLFDPHGAAHVANQQLASRRHLDRMTDVPAFPADAITVKLTWYAVKAHGITTMPIWDGETPQPNGNPDHTWSREIRVDPDGADGVPLADFIYRDLDTDEEVANARIVAHDPTLARGDHIALVAAHVTTKEIPDWTWETYWWHDAPDRGPFAEGRPDLVRGAASHYLMDVTYSADKPCFNPWLEARFPDGQASNCVTCHQRAVVGAADYLPVTRGRLRDDDPYFRGHIQTDFLWSVAFEAR
ncbi:MAG: hypothetical protein QM831_17120 [Kofleriaceae bacterium]